LQDTAALAAAAMEVQDNTVKDKVAKAELQTLAVVAVVLLTIFLLEEAVDQELLF
jgi:hypothetical protein